MPGETEEGESETRASRHPPRRSTGRLGKTETKKVEFGSGSIFDAEVQSADRLPFELPVKKFMEEGLVGLCGAPHFGHGEEQTSQARLAYKRLRRIVFTDNACGICEALTWVAIGSLFSTVSQTALDDLRSRLARSWFLLTIDLGKTDLLGNLAFGTREQVLHVLPTFLVQVVLRLLLDAFPADQRVLVSQMEALVEKLTCIVHKEVLGYPLAPKTAIEIRRQLFRKRVIECPQMNCLETIERVRRYTVMESSQVGQRPLTFGEKGKNQLEEMQREHVLEDRYAQKDEAKKRPRHHEATHLLSRLENYARLAMDGEELFMRQMDALYADADNASESEGTVLTVPQTPEKYTSDLREQNEASGGWTAEVVQGPEVKGNIHVGRSSRRSFSITANTLSSTTTIRFHREREKREAEAHERKRRDDLLTSRITAPLGEAFSHRPLEKAMVSPIINRHLGNEDCKPSPPKSKWKCICKVYESEAAQAQKPANEGLPEIPGLGSVGTASLAAATATGQAVAAMTRSSEGLRSFKSKKRFPLIDGRSGALGTGAIAAAAAESLQQGSSPSGTKRETTVLIDLNAQHDIKGSEILKRLELQKEANVQASFDVYKKDYDIQTGLRKQRMNGGKMNTEENQYLENLETLVGSRSEPALRLPRGFRTALANPR